MTTMKPGPPPVHHDAPADGGTDQPYRRPGEEHLIGRIVHAVANNIEGASCQAAIIVGHSDAPPAGVLYLGMEPAKLLYLFPPSAAFGGTLEWRYDPKGTLIFTYHWPRNCPFSV